MKKQGNTVGSLTEKQQALIIGCLLGDGAMRCKTNALLEINHAIRQRRYVDWKYSALRDLVATPPRSRRSGYRRTAYRFTTKSLPVLTNIYRQFYRNDKKIIPENLVLHPLSLSVWFMDDGTKSYRAVYLNTQRFTMQNQKYLIELLRKQHQIKASLNRDKIYYRLRIVVESIGRFKSIIKPYILPMFSYKLPL